MSLAGDHVGKLGCTCNPPRFAYARTILRNRGNFGPDGSPLRDAFPAKSASGHNHEIWRTCGRVRQPADRGPSRHFDAPRQPRQESGLLFLAGFGCFGCCLRGLGRRIAGFRTPFGHRVLLCLAGSTGATA